MNNIAPVWIWIAGAEFIGMTILALMFVIAHFSNNE